MHAEELQVHPDFGWESIQYNGLTSVGGLFSQIFLFTMSWIPDSPLAQTTFAIVVGATFRLLRCSQH